MKDTQGREFAVGDKIVYPVRHGSYMGVESAVVIGFDTLRNRLLIKAGNRNTWLQRWDRATVVLTAGLNITPEEATSYCDFYYSRVGGDPTYSRRRLFSSLYNKLLPLAAPVRNPVPDIKLDKGFWCDPWHG